jgi:lipid-A-disaccharide synthase
MKYYVVAGETSGDLHGSNLLREIKRLDPSASFRGFGGDRMEQEGTTLVKHIRDLDFMGFVEVLLNIRKILSLMKVCKTDLLQWKPDALILIDYPGFNLRMAEFAKQSGIKVFYYISPQLWAWKKRRIVKIRKFVDHLFIILPFEKEFYARLNYDVDFVGHPLLDAMEVLPLDESESFRKKHGLDERPIIAVLPGSRKQEIRRILPVMIQAVNAFGSTFQFVIAGTSNITHEYYRQLIGNAPVNLLYGQTYSLLMHARSAMVTSGTATLETALLNVPQVVCYKANPGSFFIAKKLVKLNYISLVNLILDREVVKELIQNEMNAENLLPELQMITSDSKKREQILKDYVELASKLGGKGASRKTAGLILKYLSAKT